MKAIHIKNGHLIDPANHIDAATDIYIQHGKIVGIGSKPDNFKPEQTIDANNLIVCPGLIDLNVRIREPGEVHKASLNSEATAAIQAGITTICCPPDTQPIMDTPSVASMIYHRAQRLGYSRVLLIGAATKDLAGQQLSNMRSLMNHHCIALSNANQPIENTLVERRIMEYAKTFGFTLILKPQDTALTDGGCAHEGAVSTRLGLTGIPEAAETVALAKDLALITGTGCKIHFEGISCARSVFMLDQAIKAKLPITAGTPIHQLHLTELDVDGFNSNCHVYPPLRTTNDKTTLRQGINNGTLSVIYSDHQPHENDAKLSPFPSTEPGISGLDTLLSLTIKLVKDHIISMSTAISCLTAGPAKAMNLPYGSLAVGDIADICIFDPDHYATLTRESMQSAGKNSPFIGWELPAQVTHTLLEGKLVFERDTLKVNL